MKKLILLLITTLTIISCSETKEIKRIEWTSSSEEAKVLFEEFLTNLENRNWDPKVQEALFDSIVKLDPDFYVPKLFNTFKDVDERRRLVRVSYENRNKVSDLESRYIESEYERRINGSKIIEDQILDSLISDYPQYYQLRIWSGDVKNGIDAKASEKRWMEAMEINPNSFEAYIKLAFLHVPTGGTSMLATDQRDLAIAEDMLNKAQKILPNSSRPQRYLGNVYRAQSEFDKSLAAYNKSLEMIAKYESGDKSDPYANSLLMVGHVYTFQGQYDKAREIYDKAMEISNDFWKVNMTELKAHTHMYQKDFAGAIFILSDMQEKIKDFDVTDLQKFQWTFWMEWQKFLAFGHSQKQEETIGSLKKMNELSVSADKIRYANAANDQEKQRISLNSSSNMKSFDVWYNILFGDYESARVQLEDYKAMSQKRLTYNPNAMDNFHKLSGYLNLMEGSPQDAIDSYSNLSDEVLTDDNYHLYFLALAKKALGKTEESTELFAELANNNFAQWQNAIVKNLAKAQIKTNL